MARIYVNKEGMEDLKSRLYSISNRVNGLENNIARSLNSLDWEVSQKELVRGRILEARKKASALARQSSQMRMFVEKALHDFSSTDSRIAGKQKESLNFLERIWKGLVNNFSRTYEGLSQQSIKLLESIKKVSDFFLHREFGIKTTNFSAIKTGLLAVAPVLGVVAPFIISDLLKKRIQMRPYPGITADPPSLQKPTEIGQSGIKGKNEWIPSVMQLDGSSKEEKRLKQYFKAKGIKWEQEKIDSLWKATTEINNRYGIQIDPRFLLAIIIQEGTGSFNTSSVNRAADGQHGIETNFALDLMKANSLIFGKILGYIYYGEEFRQAVANNNKSGITGSGDIFQYANWETPIIRLNSNKVETGVYAGHGLWCDGVRKIYNDLTGVSATDYENYISIIDKSVVENIAREEGIKLPSYSFDSVQNAQNYDGKPNGQYTIIGKK